MKQYQPSWSEFSLHNFTSTWNAENSICALQRRCISGFCVPLKRNLVVAGLPYPNQGSGLEESLPVLQLCCEYQQFCNNCAHVILSFGNQQCIYTVRVLLCAYFTGVGCCIFSSEPHTSFHGSLSYPFFFLHFFLLLGACILLCPSRPCFLFFCLYSSCGLSIFHVVVSCCLLLD